MKKRSLFCLAVALLGFVVNPMVVAVQAANEYAEIKLPSGKTFKVTKDQIETLKKQPGIKFSKEATPGNLDEVFVKIPEELGGEYIIGTPEAIASAFNTAEITVGLTAEAILGALKTAEGFALGTLVGIIVGSFIGEGAAAHHSATHH